MYANLRAEMARKNITLTELAKLTDMRLGTISLKMNGKSEFTFSEAVRIKQALGVDVSLDELFEKVA